MTHASQESVKNTWEAYWSKDRVTDFELPNLSAFQSQIFDIIKDLVRNEGCRTILCAGCGFDVVAAHLQRAFDGRLEITLLDISSRCLDMNKKLFENNEIRLNAVIEGSVFDMPFENQSFDLVYNTGLMEHFTEDDQISMVSEIIRVINNGGFYVSANPSDRGMIYKYGMRVAQRKGTWEYGVEIPIKSLQFTKKYVREISSITEVERDFVGQLNFLNYVSRFARHLFLPFHRLNRVRAARTFMDKTLGKLFGTYLLISTFRKKSG